MARPKKKTLDYFPHFTVPGKTLFILESRWGNDGYAFWFKLLEVLCQSENLVSDTGNPAEWEFLLAKTHVNEETANGILNKLAELGNIDSELWSKGLVWCDSLVENVKDAFSKRKDAVPRKPVSDTGNPAEWKLPEEKHPEINVSDNENGEIKLNKNKLNNTPLTPPGEIVTVTKKIDYQDVVDEYNRTCDKMPKALSLNDSRRRAIRSRLKEHGRDAISQVFSFARGSPYHNGSNDSGWTADLDWLMGPKNFVKMLERSISDTTNQTGGKSNGANCKFVGPPKSKAYAAQQNPRSRKASEIFG